MPFKKGQSGNPKGSPKGGRPKLKFLAMYKEIIKNGGARYLERLAEENLVEFFKIYVSLMPKEKVRKPSTPKLQGDEELVKFAERKLTQLCSANNLAAIKFVLTNKGDYAEKTDSKNTTEDITFVD